MDKKPVICWDDVCGEGYPICCFDCEKKETCGDPCTDENCRGENEERKRKMVENTVDVKGTVNVKAVHRPAMLEVKKADARSAFERLTFARETLKEYKIAINKTNTNDIAGELLRVYADLEMNLNLIIILEQQLILDGE